MNEGAAWPRRSASATTCDTASPGNADAMLGSNCSLIENVGVEPPSRTVSQGFKPVRAEGLGVWVEGLGDNEDLGIKAKTCLCRFFLWTPT